MKLEKEVLSKFCLDEVFEEENTPLFYKLKCIRYAGNVLSKTCFFKNLYTYLNSIDKNHPNMFKFKALCSRSNYFNLAKFEKKILEKIKKILLTSETFKYSENVFGNCVKKWKNESIMVEIFAKKATKSNESPKCCQISNQEIYEISKAIHDEIFKFSTVLNEEKTTFKSKKNSLIISETFKHDGELINLNLKIYKIIQ